MDTWEWTIFRGLMEKPFCNVSAPFFLHAETKLMSVNTFANSSIMRR